ncbi:MAG TPA: tetratricopeptide repeat protein, partial [Pyrinomonadaceae bacterium]|nr:tetratricopeptide repeat protein [Pyrinomonadaceae bacterium]
MRCLLLKAFLVMLSLAAVTFGQDKSDTQSFRFTDAGPNHNNPDPNDPAVEAIRKKLAAEPNNAISFYDLGMTYYKAGDFNGAADSFRRLTELLPDSAVAHNQLGVALLEAHRDQEALKSFTTALKLKPGDPVMMVNAGFIYVRLGKFKEAIELFEAAKGAKEIANFEDYYVNLAYSYAKRKRYADAIEALRRGIELDP